MRVGTTAAAACVGRHSPVDICSVRVLSSPTEDMEKLISSLADLRPDGEGSLIATLKTAMVRAADHHHPPPTIARPQCSLAPQRCGVSSPMPAAARLALLLLCRRLLLLQLAMRLRKNKNGKMRIVVFIGSPVAGTAKEYETLGAALRKDSVSGGGGWRWLAVVVVGRHPPCTNAHSHRHHRAIRLLLVMGCRWAWTSCASGRTTPTGRCWRRW